MTTKTLERKVPAGAMQFAADVDVQPAGESGNVPVTIKARTGKPIFHWYWGNVIHDLAGMQPNKASIPLDYCHDPGDVVGFADKFDTSSGDLVVAGTLTPFQEGDRANEIIHKGKQGVPYEASIYFDPYEVVIEDVRAGASVVVNGVEFHGPGVVIRQWKLRGLAVCPYGADRSTSVEFSDRPDVTVRALSEEPAVPKTTLSGKPAKPAKPAKPKTNPATSLADGDEKPKDEEKKEEGEQDEESDDDEEETSTDDEKKKDDEEDAGKQAAKASPGAKFLTAFGEKGGVWFAEGRTFEEAQELYTKHLKEENAKLSTDNKALKSKLKLAAGEENPVGFSAPPTDADKARAQLENKVGSKGLAAFAAGIKLPGQS